MIRNRTPPEITSSPTDDPDSDAGFGGTGGRNVTLAGVRIRTTDRRGRVAMPAA
jgi:hypothetical protein